MKNLKYKKVLTRKVRAKIKTDRGERWKLIDFDVDKYQYLISNVGRIKRLNLVTGEERLLEGGIIAGFKVVQMRNKTGTKCVYIHRFIAEEFIGKSKRKDRIMIIHKDGNKLNNFTSNLKWATRKELRAHQVSIGMWDEAIKKKNEELQVK